MEILGRYRGAMVEGLLLPLIFVGEGEGDGEGGKGKGGKGEKGEKGGGGNAPQKEVVVKMIQSLSIDDAYSLLRSALTFSPPPPPPPLPPPPSPPPWTPITILALKTVLDKGGGGGAGGGGGEGGIREEEEEDVVGGLVEQGGGCLERYPEDQRLLGLIYTIILRYPRVVGGGRKGELKRGLGGSKSFLAKMAIKALDKLE